MKCTKTAFLGALSALLLFGCHDKEERLSIKNSEDLCGEKDTISITLASHSTDLSISKSIINLNDQAINNINAFVFNEFGDVITHRYESGSSTVINNLIIYKNLKYKIYVIANAGKSMPIKTINEIETLKIKIDNIYQLTDSQNGSLMNGNTELQTLTNGQQVPVALERCVAKFILQCDYSQLHPGVRVTVKRVQLKNAPKEIRLFGGSKASGGAVIDGEIRTGSDLNPLSGSGAAFYLFENLQGVVAPSALDNKNKEQQMSATAKANSSYIEMEYDYVSSDKAGTIMYRFYLGKTFADCDVKRNTQYHCTVLFKGNGSAGENSWSVDNSQLVDRVKGITLSPTSHIMSIGEQLQIRATVLPATAHNSALSWNSSNPIIASVDASGKVTALADGACTISATSTDGTNISASCSLVIARPELAFTFDKKVMYDGEEILLSYSQLSPAGAIPEGISSAPGVVEVLEYTNAGVKVKALTPGNAIITATLMGVSTTCAITVEKLRIVPTTNALMLYTHFNSTVNYTIHPAHAAQLPIKGEHGNSSDAAYFIFPDASIPNRVQGKVAKNSILPIKLSIVGRPDVTTTVYCMVSPCLQVNDQEFLYGAVDILANAYISKTKNKKYPDIYVKRQVSYAAAPQATVVWECNKPGVTIDKGLIYTSDTSPANGSGYYVTVSVTGDDGVVTSFTNAKGISFYEEIHLIFEGNGTLIGEDSSTGEMLPLFDVLFSNRVSGEMPGAPIKKEVIPAGLLFNNQPWTYYYSTQIYGARGDTDYIQRSSVTVTERGKEITKYKEPSNQIFKYFITN